MKTKEGDLTEPPLTGTEPLIDESKDTESKARVEKGVEFLASTKAAPKEKKIEFLLKKGLSREEIDEAMNVVDSAPLLASTTTSPTLPPIPSRPLQDRPMTLQQPRLYHTQQPIQKPWNPRIIALILAISSSASLSLTFYIFRFSKVLHSALIIEMDSIHLFAFSLPIQAPKS